MNCALYELSSYLHIYTRGIDNICFSYMWREYMIIFQHVMLHLIQYVECNVQLYGESGLCQPDYNVH